MIYNNVYLCVFYVSGLYERSKLIRKCTRAEGMEFSIPMRLLSRYFDLPFLVPQKRVVGKITRPDTRPSVADGWAGAEMRIFTLFDSWSRTDRPTDGSSNEGRIDCNEGRMD